MTHDRRPNTVLGRISEDWPDNSNIVPNNKITTNDFGMESTFLVEGEKMNQFCKVWPGKGSRFGNQLK